MKTTWADQIETWDRMIKAGQGGAVARQLAHLPRSIPLDQMSKIANIAWRINRPSIGLKLLFPEIRRHNSLRMKVHPEALTEYAGCLLEVGAAAEAKMILREVGGEAPRSRFYLALLAFKEWDYEAAVPLLERYLSEIPTSYHQMVARVNLAAAYVNTGRGDQALALLSELKTELERQGHRLLLGNCCEIESQIHFQARDYRRALALLDQSEGHLSDTKNMGWLYCKKWQLLNRMGARTSLRVTPQHFADEYENLKTSAISMGSWETLRELDLFTAIYERDSRLATHVYFGSPQAKYRQRIVQMAPELKIGESYVWGAGSNTYELSEVVVQNASESFLLRKLLLILSSDFYGGFRVGQLFSNLFEGEFYDPENSPDRVFQLVRRLRTWLRNKNWNISVGSEKKGYVLHMGAGHGLNITRGLVDGRPSEKTNVLQMFVQEKFGSRVFTATELGKLLDCSTRSANRRLHELKESGSIEVLGKGRFTRFKLAG